MTFHRVLFSILLAVVPSVFAQTQDVAPDRISNWPAPPFWNPSQTPRAAGTVEGAQPSGKATASTPLPFIAITPCRIADTRGNGFTGAYGPPSVGADTVRSFKITGVCGVPAGAAAASFNFSALNVFAAGDLRVFPSGGAAPMVSTINYNADTPNIANAAVVTLGTDGAVAVLADAATIDLIIDVNGYYAGSVVTSANGIAGDVTVKGAGSVSVSTSGNGITVTGPATLPPSGPAEGDLTGNYPNPSLGTGVVTGSHLASGYVVRSINGSAQDNVTIVGGGEPSFPPSATRSRCPLPGPGGCLPEPPC